MICSENEVGEHKIFFSLMEVITMMTRKNTSLDRTAELLLRSQD